MRFMVMAVMTKESESSAQGTRVKFSGDQRIVIDGSFAESKELVAGFTILQVNSKEEAIE